jgi:phosphohistidine phosphatase
MEIYLVRHGIAEDELLAARAGKADPQRSLTEEGLEKTTKVAKAFKKRVEEVDCIFHSSYLRAKQTAEIFSKVYPNSKVEELADLRPSDSTEMAIENILEFQNYAKIMVVGHEPHLSKLLSRYLVGSEEMNLTFKKAGIAGIEYSFTGPSRLLFFLTPKILLG